MWYGEFIHGMLEEAFLLWRNSKPAFPWPYTEVSTDTRPGPPEPGLEPHDIRSIGWPIETSLAQQGKRARSRDARASAYRRAATAINTLGPTLFHLIETNEQKIIGTRELPSQEAPTVERRADQYGLKGIIDVLSQVTLSSTHSDNAIRAAVAEIVDDTDGAYEVIVDYKGSRRPPVSDDPRSEWQLGQWQVLTYAWLRQRQPEARPVAACVLVYVNELSPGGGDYTRLLADINQSRTDVFPEPNSDDDNRLRAYTPGTEPGLSAEFLLKRALRVIPVTDAAIEEATTAFDGIVSRIEHRVATEAADGSIRTVWEANCTEEATCVACDFKEGCEHAVARGWNATD